jgi:uncharacterized protein (UPF0332 family)
MSSWQELGIDSLKAAKTLHGKRLWRSSASRAYYAAYSAVTAEIVARNPKQSFRHGWRNPAHGELPRYVRERLCHLPPQTRRSINTNLRLLYKLREDADYRPQASVDEQTATMSCRVASAVFRELRVNE